MPDFDQYETTAAWLQYCDGMTRFQAETEAARRQGMTRWQMNREAANEKRERDSQRGGDNRQAMGGQRSADHMPGMQRGAAQEGRPMPERDAQAGRAGVALLALQPGGRGVL